MIGSIRVQMFRVDVMRVESGEQCPGEVVDVHQRLFAPSVDGQLIVERQIPHLLQESLPLAADQRQIVRADGGFVRFLDQVENGCSGDDVD